jgi:SAM-dependent methyltransferase
MENCVEIKRCIACGSNNLVPLLDLGLQPLANSFLKNPTDQEDKFPLATNYCKDCYHVQLTHKVNPDLLFKNYLYVSGTAKTQLEYFDWFAKFVNEYSRTNLKIDTIFDFNSVLDIGCNDGSQLDAFKKLGVKTFGVDPAENLHSINSKNHSVHCGYFDENFPGENFSAVICQNAFAHNYDQLNFLKNMGRVVSNYGHIFITTSQAHMILNGEFDTIYHEHLSFYNIKSMNELCKRAGLNLIDVVKHPIHGTSYIFVISKYKSRSVYIEHLIKEEESMDVYTDEVYESYKIDCEEIIKVFADTVKVLRETKKVVGYGAPAKGNTLLNAAGVSLDYIVDDNPLKQGLYTPGMHVPVYGSEALKNEDDDLVFVPLAWNFFEEIKAKIKASRPGRGDMFLKYFPFVYMG